MVFPPFAASSSPVSSFHGDMHASYRSPRMLAKLTTAALILNLAALAVVGALLWDSLGVAQALAAGDDVADASFELLERRGQDFELVSFAVLIAGALTFCLWTYRVARNAIVLGGRLTSTPGWAVAYYFIPIVNWWMPYAALTQVWDASHPDPRGVRSACGAHALVLSWWVAWLITGAVDLVAFGREVPVDAQAWANQIQLGLGALVVEAIAAVLAIAVVWRLTHRQDARAAASLPTARVA
jgi:hypothetical protein